MTAALVWPLLFGLLAAPPAPPDLALAARLFDEGRYELALDALSALQPADLEAGHAAHTVYLRAESFHRLGLTREAREAFARLRTDYPDSPWLDPALSRLISLSLEAGGLPEAQGFLSELALRFPDSRYRPAAMLSVGFAVLRSGDEAAAADTLVAWLDRYRQLPEAAAARVGLARAYVGLGRYPEAAEQCRAVLGSATAPQPLSDAALLFAETLYREGSFDDLASRGARLADIIADATDALRARILHAIALVRVGRAGEGSARLEALLEDGAASETPPELLVDAHLALAGAVLAASPRARPERVYAPYDAALALLESASEMETYRAVLNRKGVAAWSLGDATTALSCFRSSQETGGPPPPVGGAVNLGWALVSLGRHREAAAAYDAALAREPRPPGWEWAAVGKAECLCGERRWDECLSAAAEAPRAATAYSPIPADLLRPEGADALARRVLWLQGSAALALDRLAPAGEAFGRLLQAGPGGSRDRSLGLLGLAGVAARQDNPGRAALLYEQSLAGVSVALPPSPAAGVLPELRSIVEPALFGLARARHQLGELEVSLALVDAALALFPDSSYAGESLLRRGEILESLRRFDEARDSYLRLANRTPVGPLTLEAGRRAALIDTTLGRWAEAETALRELLAMLEPAQPSLGGASADLEEAIRYDLGNLYLSTGKHPEAAAEFARNVERFPEGPGTDRNLYRLAQARYNSGRFDEAAATYQRLIDRRPPSALQPDALLWLGWSYQNLGRKDEAKAAWERLEREFPESQSAPLAAAAWAQQVESASPARAAALWSRLAETYRGSSLAPPALFRAGLLALEAVEPATAVRYLRRYHEGFPESARAVESYAWEGMGHEMAQSPALAREAFENYLSRTRETPAGREDPLRAAVVAGLARSLRDLGDPHGAAAFLQTELARPGGRQDAFRDAWALLGDLLFESGRPDEALPAYRHAVSLARGDRLEARAVLRVGECLEAMGRLKQAALEYVKVAYLYESVSDLAALGMMRAGDLFERLGNYREAVRSYRRALELSLTPEQKAQIEARVAWLEEHLPLLELELPQR